MRSIFLSRRERFPLPPPIYIYFAILLNVSVFNRLLYTYTRLSNSDIAVATEVERSKIRGDPVQLSPEISDHVFERPKGLFREFLYDVNPISAEEWTKSGILLRIVLVIRSPAMFLLQLSIPVVDPTAAKNGWSKLLNCFQLCVTPTIALFPLEG